MSASPFTGRLVPRFQSCPPPPGQAAAATDVPASVAALPHSCPAPHGQVAASGFGHALPDAASFSITLSPAVALILRLVETARPDLPRDELFARAIGIYAQHLGVPALARDMDDLADVPEFDRAAKSRFRSGGP